MNKLPTGTLSSLHAYRQLNQGRSSLLQNTTVGSPSPFPVSSYRNFIFAFDRMNLLSFSSFPCAKVNSTLIINSIPLDYSLTVFIIFPPSHHSPSFSTWNLPRSLSLSSALVTFQTSNGCLLGWSIVLVCPGLRLVVGVVGSGTIGLSVLKLKLFQANQDTSVTPASFHPREVCSLRFLKIWNTFKL